MGNYIFLMSSLPQLVWGEAPPLTRDEFESACAGQLTPAELERLSRVNLEPPFDAMPAGLASRFADWDTCLRNALIAGRSGERDGSAYLRVEHDFFSEISSVVTAVAGASTPLEAEKWLDTARWEALDMLLGSESFNFDALANYKLKLLLMLKNALRTVERGRANLEAVVAHFENEVN